MPGELVGGLLAPGEPGLVVEPPEEDGHDSCGGGEREEDDQGGELSPTPLPHRDPVTRHLTLF